MITLNATVEGGIFSTAWQHKGAQKVRHVFGIDYYVKKGNREEHEKEKRGWRCHTRTI
jgi:hypothetical protein